jgi:hypothetical protein
MTPVTTASIYEDLRSKRERAEQLLDTRIKCMRLANDQSTTEHEREAAAKKAEELRVQSCEISKQIELLQRTMAQERQAKALAKRRALYGNCIPRRHSWSDTLVTLNEKSQFHVIVRRDGVIELTVDVGCDYKHNRIIHGKRSKRQDFMLLIELSPGDSFAGWAYADLLAHGNGFVKATKLKKRRLS